MRPDNNSSRVESISHGESTIDVLRASYRSRLVSADPLEAELARAQLERLDHGRRSRARTSARQIKASAGVSEDRDYIRPWRGVLESLLTASGCPPVRWRGDHVFECAHAPYHASKSGVPVLVDLVAGSFWCRSCGQRGGAAEWLAAWKGLPIKAARRLLDARYGDGAPKPSDLEVVHE